jgi:hypothetical protein
MPASELERPLWVRQENERRKGRKGRILLATIRRVRFVNDINHVDVHGGSRFALGAAEIVRRFAVSPKGCTPGAP